MLLKHYIHNKLLINRTNNLGIKSNLFQNIIKTKSYELSPATIKIIQK